MCADAGAPSQLGMALAAARAAVRVDFRAAVLAELAAEPLVELPPHIARVPVGSVADFVDAAPVRPTLAGKKTAVR